MKLFGAVIFYFIVNPSTSTILDYSKMHRHVSLIVSFYERYRISGLIILSADEYFSSETMLYWHTFTKQMSNHGITAVIVSSSNFVDRLEFYISNSISPLVVIFINSMDDLYHFAKLVRNFNAKDAIWLLVFSGSNDENICEFCRHPQGNLFNLGFTSEATVICCETTIIHEWWSIRKDQTNVGTLGRQSDENGKIQWFSRKSLFQRRSSLEGLPFRVYIMKGSSEIWLENGKIHGYSGKLLEALSQSMNFTLSFIKLDRGHGHWDPELLEWTGVIGKIIRGEADMGVGAFMMTSERLEVIDFTTLTSDEFSIFYIRKPNAVEIQWEVYVEAFHTDVWLVMIALILVMSLVLTLIKYKKMKLFVLISENCWSIWGIYCQQGLSEFPADNSRRIISFSVIVSAVVVSASYTASLTSLLAISESQLPFRTINEFIAAGTHRLIAVANSADHLMFQASNETVIQKIWPLMNPDHSMPHNLRQGFHQVCHEKVAFHITSSYRDDYLSQLLSCEIIAIPMKRIQSSSFILPLHSEYSKFFAYHINRFKHNGLIGRFKQQYKTKRKSSNVTFSPVEAQGIAPVLGVLAVGFIIAVLIFMTERILHNYYNKLRNAKMRKLQKTIEWRSCPLGGDFQLRNRP